jgi:hypothetical protein
MTVHPEPLAIVAALWEDKGYTGPDRHDVLLAQFGQRVRVAEVGQDPGEPVKVMCGETTLRRIKRLFQRLPNDHNLGIVQIAIGKTASYELVNFLKQQARVKNFTVVSLIAPRSAEEIFDDFFYRINELTSRK